MWFAEQLIDDTLAFVLGRVEHKRRDVLGRRDVADDVEPDAAEVGSVVDARGEFRIGLEDFLGDERVDLVGGFVDWLIGRIVEVWLSFPPVILSLILMVGLGTGLRNVILAIILVDWTRFCRVIRAEAMSQARMDYVESARIAGYGRIGIMLREVLPNELPSVVALLSLEMGIAVIVEAILSFVNLSISTDDPTWGSIIAEGRVSIHQAWWVLVFPLVTLILTVLSFSQFGEALKARFDPVLR